jgi:hypothetical protein
MATTIGHQRPKRGLQPSLDSLDRRLVLNGSATSLLNVSGQMTMLPLTASLPNSLTIQSTNPGNSTVIAASPNELSVTFDRPVDPFSLSSQDFDLLHVASDGTTSPLGPQDPTLTEELDPTDPSGQRILLTVDGKLSAGSYRLQVDPNSQLMGLDGSSLSGANSVVTGFQINRPSPSDASATDLGTVGSQVTSVLGHLDLTSDPSAVNFVKIELPAGHRWLLGTEVSAHREGSLLKSRISLFDSTGRLVATSGLGMPDDPSDPYLFQGLQPGTYYVGVSGNGNVPTSADSWMSSQSSTAPNPDGGSYHLDLVAQTADQPASVLGIQADQADPSSNQSTGLTVQFSGPLDLKSLQDNGKSALQLVDASGRAWGLTPTFYDPAAGRLSLAFDQAIPQGSYLLQLHGSGSLLDLSGLVPVAKGFPAGTLGSLTISGSSPSSTGLGPIYPAQAQTGLSATALSQPSGPTDEQDFEVVEPGIYAIDQLDTTPGVRFLIRDQAGKSFEPAADPGQPSELVYLPAGTYQLSVASDGPASRVAFKIRLAQGVASSLLDAGVAQGPALALRLTNPTLGLGQTVTTTTPSSQSTQANPTTPQPSQGASSPSTIASEGQSEGSSEISSRTEPVSADSDRFYPSFNSSAATIFAQVASRSVSSSFLGGGLIGSPLNAKANADSTGGAGDDSRPGGNAMRPIAIGRGLSRKAATDHNHGEGRPIPEASNPSLDQGLTTGSSEGQQEDNRSILEANVIGEILAEAMQWFDLTPDRVVGGKNEFREVASISAEGERSLEPERNRVESASLTSPIGIGIILGGVAIGIRNKLRSARPSPVVSSPQVRGQTVFKGPHRRSTIRVR